MARAVLFLAWKFCSLSALARPLTCPTGQQYNELTGFPAYSTGCYPFNYLSTSDLGNTDPTDAQFRCQQQCTNLGSTCGSVVAQLNKAVDSGLYSGSCFYYAPENTPTAPRLCDNPASILGGYVKDNTLACLLSSTVAATTFCQSVLKNTVTSTVTTSPATSTQIMIRVAIATTSTTTSVTRTVSATSTVTASTTVTVSTTVATTTDSMITSVTTFITSTGTVTSFTTVTVAPAVLAARAVGASAAPPACISSGTPNSRLTSACSCFNANPATTTKTVAAPTPIAKKFITTTTTTTVPVTASATVTVTSATTTTTFTTTSTISLTATTSTIITKSITSTVPATTTVISTKTTTANLPLQTISLTVHGSSDPALSSQGGVGYSNLESFRGSNTVYYGGFTANSATTQKYTLKPSTGELKALNGPGNAAGESCYYASTFGGASYINISPNDFATNQGGELCV